MPGPFGLPQTYCSCMTLLAGVSSNLTSNSSSKDCMHPILFKSKRPDAAAFHSSIAGIVMIDAKMIVFTIQTATPSTDTMQNSGHVSPFGLLIMWTPTFYLGTNPANAGGL